MSLGLSQSQVYSALNSILKPENPQRGSVTCVGYAPSKGRRCQWAINVDNRAAFAQKLYELAGTDLKDISGYLYDLASLGLCLRYHQSQASQVAAQWSRQINSWLREQSTIGATQYRSERTTAFSRSDAIRAGTTGASDAQIPARTAFRLNRNSQNTARREEVIEVVERTSGLHTSTRDRFRPQVVQPSQATPSSPRPPQTSTFSNLSPTPRVEPISSTSQPSLRSVLEDIPPVPRTEPTSSPGSSSRADLANLPSPPSSEFTFTAGRRLASLEQASTSDANTQPIPNLPYVFATNFSAATTLPAPTPQNQRTPPPTVVAPSPPTMPVQATPLPAAAAPTVPSTVTATPPTTATPATEERQCTASHAERKSLEDDCPICQEPLELTPLADLVWCKAQCGTNFHRECWAEWESSQLGSTSTGLPTLRCAFCRTSWPTPCHHDTSTPPAAPTIQPEPAADDDAAAAADDDDEEDTFFPPSFFDPRSHAWSLWSPSPSAAATTTTTSSSPDHSSPLAALFDPARHTRPLLRDRRARADVFFFALPAATAADADDEEARGDGDGEGDGLHNDIAAALAALFNPRVHRRVQVFNCGWEAEESGTGFDVLFDAKRHGRALRSERLARAAVLDGDDDGDGGVLGALFEEEVCEVEEEEKQQGGKERELQMVYVTLVDDPGKEEEREGGDDEEEQEEPTGLCERMAWWVCGRRFL